MWSLSCAVLLCQDINRGAVLGTCPSFTPFPQGETSSLLRHSRIRGRNKHPMGTATCQHKAMTQAGPGCLPLLEQQSLGRAASSVLSQPR